MPIALSAVPLGLFGAIAGCGPRPVQIVSNPDPSGAIPAIKRAAIEHDATVEPDLVRDLDNVDSAVRFYAIEGLRRLTGETFGYRYYDDESKRRQAIDRWRQWLAAGAHRSSPVR